MGRRFDFLPEFYEDEKEIRDAYWNVGPGQTVVDVGARYGSWTIPALACSAAVVAVDINAAIVPELVRVAHANGLDDGLEVHCVGLWDGRTEYPAALRAENPEAPIRWSGARWSTLDELVAGRHVDWVKIDVEGAELGVLAGGLETLKTFRPTVIVEDHTRVYAWARRNHIGVRVRALLTGLRYTVETVPYKDRDFTIGSP